MKLTGKAKEDFLVWYFNTYLKEDKYCLIKDIESFFKTVKPTLQNALIIEWFDSVGIYFNNGLSFIKHKKYKCEIYQEENDNILGNCFVFRGKYLSHDKEEVIEQAIIKANEIYNER